MPVPIAAGPTGLMDRPRVILFDLDGTLVPTMGAFADLAAAVMASRFGDERAPARERYLATSGIPFRLQLERIHRGDPRNDAASDEFEMRKAAIADATTMDADTRAGIAALHERGIRIVVSSNAAQRFVDGFVRRERFPFDLALGFGDGLAKGEPHVRAVCRAFGVRRDEIVAVGDSLSDAESAACAGVRFVGRLGTFDRAAFARAFPGLPVIERIGELVRLLR